MKIAIEVKCPRPARHVQYIQAGKVPPEYLPQIALQAACGGFDAVDFVSYCPSMPEKLRLFVVRWMRDDAYIAQMEEAISKFLGEVAADEAKLREMAA